MPHSTSGVGSGGQETDDLLDFDDVNVVWVDSRLRLARDVAAAAAAAAAASMPRWFPYFLTNSSATDTEEGEATAAANAGERNWAARENFMMLSVIVFVSQ